MRPSTLRLLTLATAAVLLLALTGAAPAAVQHPQLAAPGAAVTPPFAPPPVAPAALPGAESLPGRPERAPEPVTPQAAPPPASQPFTNVRVEVTLTDQTGTAPPFKKSVSLVGLAPRPREMVGMIRSSIQVPMRSTSSAASGSKDSEKEGASAAPAATYSYRSMSLNLDVRDMTIEGNRIRLQLGVEYSPVDEKTAEARGVEGLASFASFQQTLTLVLEDGKPLVVAQSSDPVPTRDRRITVEAKATILK